MCRVGQRPFKGVSHWYVFPIEAGLWCFAPPTALVTKCMCSGLQSLLHSYSICNHPAEVLLRQWRISRAPIMFCRAYWRPMLSSSVFIIGAYEWSFKAEARGFFNTRASGLVLVAGFAFKGQRGKR